MLHGSCSPSMFSAQGLAPFREGCPLDHFQLRFAWIRLNVCALPTGMLKPSASTYLLICKKAPRRTRGREVALFFLMLQLHAEGIQSNPVGGGGGWQPMRRRGQRLADGKYRATGLVLPYKQSSRSLRLYKQSTPWDATTVSCE